MYDDVGATLLVQAQQDTFPLSEEFQTLQK